MTMDDGVGVKEEECRDSATANGDYNEAMEQGEVVGVCWSCC